MRIQQRKKKTYLVSVYLEHIPVEAECLEEAIKLAKKEVFLNGLTLLIEATVDQEDIARDQAGEEIEEDEDDCFQWDILEDLSSLVGAGRN